MLHSEVLFIAIVIITSRGKKSQACETADEGIRVAYISIKIRQRMKKRKEYADYMLDILS
jgi:hypothetical protein